MPLGRCGSALKKLPLIEGKVDKIIINETSKEKVVAIPLPHSMARAGSVKRVKSWSPELFSQHVPVL